MQEMMMEEVGEVSGGIVPIILPLLAGFAGGVASSLTAAYIWWRWGPDACKP